MTSTPSFSAAPRPDSPPSAPDPAPAPAPASNEAPLRVAALGADADGIAARSDGSTVFLSGALPGELVQPATLTRRGQSWAASCTIIEPSTDRTTPPCRHFGPCGGCSIQHWADAAYAEWKRDLLRQALRRLGFNGDFPPLMRTPPAARRRMDLALRRERGGAIIIGLHARRSADVVNMTECPVLHPALFQLVQALRPVLRTLDGFKREGSAVVNLLDAGPDLLLRTDAPLSANDRTKLVTLAQALNLPRVSWAQGARDSPEPACLLRPASTSFSGVLTPIPPGAFLQASDEGEAAILAAVLDGLRTTLPRPGPKTDVIELFAGCGTLSHGIAEHARVQAFEGDPAAIAALRAARNPRVTAILRDLARQPLRAAELKRAGAVVLDPPYPGALAQMQALAASGIPILYVTCNPAALIRDGRILTAAGYSVQSAVAIDQFLWSARVEGVVTFVRQTNRSQALGSDRS